MFINDAYARLKDFIPGSLLHVHKKNGDHINVKSDLAFLLVSASTGTPLCPPLSTSMLPFSYSVLICSIPTSTSMTLC